MRLFSVGALGLLLVAVALLYYVFLELPAVHLARLVPEDFSFGLFYSSIDELRESYEAAGARRDADPGRLRVGMRVNVPDLDGIAQHEPVGSFVTAGGEEIFLVPVRDVGAFEDAFETSRENTHLRDPVQPAKNHLSLSESDARAKRAKKDNELVLRALAYPIALVGRPRDGAMLRRMLQYLLVWEPPRKPPGFLPLSHAVGALPDGVADLLAHEMDEVLLGFAPRQRPEVLDEAVRAEIEVQPRPGGLMARAASRAGAIDLGDLASGFPYDTVLFAGAVLDGAGWRDVGLPESFGDAAVGIGVVDRRHLSRRYTLLLVAQPREKQRLEALAREGVAGLLGELASELEFVEVEDEEGVRIRTAPLPGQAPEALAWLAPVYRAESRQAPPVYVCAAADGERWYAAFGSQAEGIVRHAIDTRRHPELGLQRSEAVASHENFLGEGHVGLALVTVPGLRAWGLPMPLFEIVSLAQPRWITAVVDEREGGLRAVLRIPR